MGPSDVAKIIGTTTQSLTRWKDAEVKQKGRGGEVVELVPGQEDSVPAQDEKPMAKKKQGRSPYEPTRFEAPRRNAIWQLDFMQLRVAGEVMHVVLALDDFSRFIVGHGVGDEPSTAVAVKTLRTAMARHGKPEAVRTDRGGAFLAFTKDSDFGKVLEAELIDHIVGHSYHPQGGGKVESAVGTVKRELWEVEHFATRQQAERRLSEFIDGYNHHRAHMGIDGLTPADRFMGRADRVLAEVDAVSRKRQGALAMTQSVGGAVEEMFAPTTGAPLEVLRLMIVDGVMELRFCGARVRLGRVVT